MDVNIIVSSIYAEITTVYREFNKMPNVVVLGRQVVESIKTYTREYIVDWNPTDDVLTIFGIPIVIDENNVNRITISIGHNVPIFDKELFKEV